MILIPDIRRQLGDVFSPEQADVLTNVVTEAYDKLGANSELHELRLVVREMADAQKTANEQLARTDDRLAKLAESTERRFAETTQQLAATNGRIDRMVASIEQLTDHMQQFASSQSRLIGLVRELTNGQDELLGPFHEERVASRLYAYVGDVVNRCIVLNSQEKADFFAELIATETLTKEELSDLRRADIFATGLVGTEPVVLIVETTPVGSDYDIDRTARWAAILAKTGRRGIPIMACLYVDSAMIRQARKKGVWVIDRNHLFNAER